MKKKQKKTLTDKDIYACNDFKEKRIKCGMGQKEWAETIGISLGLVKGIEGHVRRCTPGSILPLTYQIPAALKNVYCMMCSWTIWA